MNQAALVIHTFSHPFIKNVASFVHAMLRDTIDPEAKLLICDSVDDAQCSENTTIFLIGENFPLFQRRPDCRYVYLNFSVVSVLGSAWETGLQARRAILSKSRMLAKRLPLYDVVLDYYPPQTQVLQKKLNLPVLGFAVASPPNPKYTQMQDRAYDVCFVGNLSKRRQTVCEAIENLGFSLSPSTDIVIEDAAAQSRLCLNVHSVKSHHFETPRFVAAFSSGTPVVSEPSFAADMIIDRCHLLEEACSNIPARIQNLLSDQDQLDELGEAVHRWYTNTYFPNAQDSWRQTIGVLQDRLDTPRRSTVSRSAN
ncbi:MAG: hypothetical protein AAF222_00545 [Pseudomonadota bacterium]